MTPRATPMSAADRRLALIEATLPLLLEHGRAVTTRQIAEGAGVAEGTIFRVFDSKDDLVTAALEHAFDLEPFIDDLRRIEPEQPLRAIVSDLVTMLQIRFRSMFALMGAVGIVGPPVAHRHGEAARDEAAKVMLDLVAPHASELTGSPEQLVHVARLLTFSGSHPKITNGQTLSAEQIVTIVLDGMLKKDS